MQAAKNLKRANLQIVPDLVATEEIFAVEEKAAKLLLTRLSDFVDSLNDDYLNFEPWSIFNAWLDCHFTGKSEALSLFRSWQLFHWRPEPETVKQALFTAQTPTIASVFASQFAQSNSADLSATELEILDRVSDQQLDLYEIISVQHNHVVLYGAIHRQKMVVYAPEMSAKAVSGEYLLANVLPVNSEHSIFIGHSPLLPKTCKPSVDEFQSFVERCDLEKEFRNFESDVFNLFYDLTRDFEETV